MKNKMMFLTKISLNRKIKTKWFLIANLLLAVGIIAAMNIDTIITMFGGDFDNKTTIYIVDNTNYSYETLNDQIATLDKTINGEDASSYELIKDKTELEATDLIKEDNSSLLLVINEDELAVLSVKIVSNSFIDTVDYQIINTALANTKTSIALLTTEASKEELDRLYSSVAIERIVLDEEKDSADESMEMIMTTVFPVIILPFFMLTLFLVQMIGAEINDEKTTRGMEIIISNVSPKAHLMSKILAGNIFVILQGLLLFTFSAIGLGIRFIIGFGTITTGAGFEISTIIKEILDTGLADKLIYVLPLTLVLMLITFLAYSLLSGILASMTTNAEDFNQLQTPIILVSLAGYYLSMMAGLFDGALFIRILSYVPLISAILSPSLLVLGQIGVVDVIMSIVIMILFNYALIKYGLKIYKTGILNYSSKDLWKKMFKAIKNKEV